MFGLVVVCQCPLSLFSRSFVQIFFHGVTALCCVCTMDQSWVHIYSERLQNGSILAGNQECRLWCKAKRRSRLTEYGVICVKLGDQWKTVYVHRLAYILHNNLRFSDISTDCHVSHLCHNSLCVNAVHLSAEPPDINNNRQHCLHRGICTGHREDYPDCLLTLKL